MKIKDFDCVRLNSSANFNIFQAPIGVCNCDEPVELLEYQEVKTSIFIIPLNVSDIPVS